MPRSGLEETTFESVQKVIRLYDESTDDHYKIHHLTNAMSLLSSLRTFLEEKSKLLAESRGDKQSSVVSVNVNQTSNPKE